jgi:excisionase family DNA binding protein
MPTEIRGETYYTVTELAEVLSITPQTVRKYIKEGRIDSQRIGRPLLIRERAIKEFLGETIQKAS